MPTDQKVTRCAALGCLYRGFDVVEWCLDWWRMLWRRLGLVQLRDWRDWACWPVRLIVDLGNLYGRSRLQAVLGLWRADVLVALEGWYYWPLRWLLQAFAELPTAVDLILMMVVDPCCILLSALRHASPIFFMLLLLGFIGQNGRRTQKQ